MKKNLHNNLFTWLLIIFLPSSTVFSQEVPHPVSNTGIYKFLDELANDQIISINSAIKPYSRLFIANCLNEAYEKLDQLTYRQQKELDFYLRDFGKEDSRLNRLFRSTFSNTPEHNEFREVDLFSRLFKGNRGNKRLDLFYYSDSLFSITVNPVFGGEMF